jgi:putative transposon-encoded protein
MDSNRTEKHLSIYYIYTNMRAKITEKTEIKVTGITGFLEKTVTTFGNGAKVDCPKEYLGKQVYLIIRK